VVLVQDDLSTHTNLLIFTHPENMNEGIVDIMTSLRHPATQLGIGEVCDLLVARHPVVAGWFHN